MSVWEDKKFRWLFGGTRPWQREIARFVVLAALGTAASYVSVNIPGTEVFFEVRWLFGYLGFALFDHWWTALLLAGVLSLAGPHRVSLATAFIGNMSYALPALVVVRTLHQRLLDRTRSLVGYGLAWLVVVMLCYQAFHTPFTWGIMAYLRENPIWPGVLAGWRRQPYILEAVLVGVISALVMIVVRSMVALRASQHELATTLYSIGDGVIATDAEGLVRRVNPVAEELTGWSEAEALGQPLEQVFVIVDEQTGRPVDNPAACVFQKGTIVGLANHTLLISRAGRRIPIADAGAPIHDREGHITGVVLVFRDQTGERHVQQFTELRLSLIEYAAGHTLEDLLTYALDQIGDLVESPVGFYHFVEPDQRTLALQQWSSRTLDEFCQAEGEGMHYDIDQAGVWVECVHQKKPVVHNDYAALPHKKGVPPGHVGVIRELVVPVMRKDKVVAILGVGNKPAPYTQQDVERVAYLADVTWSIVQQKRAEAQVQADLAEKETLLREIHHRVKNNLQVISSLLDFQAQYTADAQAASALHESKRRVWAMALVHEQLYQPSDLSRIDMAEYVRALTADLATDRPRGPHGIEIEVEIEDVFFEVQRAIPCGMIVNELVSNALKHAFPPVANPVLPHRIRVTLHQDGPEQYCLTVCDNGVGLPADFRFPDEGSIGLFLVETFVRQLKGQIEWHDDLGTRCVIVF